MQSTPSRVRHSRSIFAPLMRVDDIVAFFLWLGFLSRAVSGFVSGRLLVLGTFWLVTAVLWGGAR